MTRKVHISKRLICLFLVLALVISLFAGLALTVFAANDVSLPANSKPRNVVCTELSTQAAAYYTGDYTYENVSVLQGVDNPESSKLAAQNNPIYTRLNALMKNTHTNTNVAYSGWGNNTLASYWIYTDAQNSSDSFYCFYSDKAYGATTSSGGTFSMDREHIWPSSKADFYQDKNSGGTDLHHMRPSVHELNNHKSDRILGNVVGYFDSYSTGYVDDTACYWYTTGTSSARSIFEPKDNVKGDVARILLYVYVRWEEPNLYADTAGRGSDPTNGIQVAESREVLLQWCQQDPVDTWEMERNDLVQDVQGNRNVFIDYPEYAWLMFGLTPPTDMTTPSGEAANGVTAYQINAVSSNDEWGTVELSGRRITAYPAAGYYAAGYEVTPEGAAEVTQNGNVFTLSNVNADCTVTIYFFPSQEFTVTYLAGSSFYSSETAFEGDTITLPATAPNVDGWSFAGWSESSFEDTTDKPAFFAPGADYTVSGNATLYAVYTKTEGGSGVVETVDVLNRAFTGVTAAQYAEWSGKTASSAAVYAGNSAGGNDSIQLRSNNNNSGIVTTASGGKVKKIVVEWNSNTVSGRTLDIYGSNTPYSAATALYSAETQGTKLGSIANGTGTELTITGDYAYIGFRSNSGAMYLTSVSITWENGTPGTTTYSVNPGGLAHVHTLNYTAAVEPGCTTEGSCEFWFCAGCGKYFSDSEGLNELTSVTIPALGHLYEGYTYDANGHWQHCERCGEDTDAEPHSITETVTTPATATEDGEKLCSCVICGYSWTEVIPAGVYKLSTGGLKDGDKVVIYSPANGRALTTTLTESYYLAGASVQPTEDEIRNADSSYVWTVTQNPDGSFSFTQGDKTLYGYVNNSYADLAVEAGEGYVSSWIPETLASDFSGSYSLRCSGLEYSAHNQTFSSVYLEYYNQRFALYGNNDLAGSSDKTPYILQFYVLEKTEPIEDEMAQVYGVSLSLKGQIEANCYLTIPDALVERGLYYTLDDAAAVQILAADKQENGRYRFSKPMPAKNMNTQVTLRLLDAEGNVLAFRNSSGGTVEAYSFCVQDYLQQVIRKPGDYAETLVALCKSMSDYGRYAQLQLGFETEDGKIWNETYLDEELSAVTAEDSSQVTDGNKVTFYGASVLMRSETVIRAYFRIEGDASAYKAYIDDASEAVELTALGNGSKYYYVEIADIPAKELGKTHTIEVGNGEDSARLSDYSVYCYVAKVLQRAGAEENLQNVVRALKLYGEKAALYF